MSILIKGMKMPESCQKCPMLEGDYLDGLCHATGRWLDDESYWKWGYYDEYDIDMSKPLNCPLVEIPPHGRLIDADALIKEWKQGFYRRIVEALMEDAPTVIEAEENCIMNEIRSRKLAAERVIFSPPATIVIWTDGTKTVVKCDERDTYDRLTGLALCYMKKALGNRSGPLNKVIREAGL